MTDERILLVGESNPYSDDPDFALYPRPRGSAGWRLCTAILGMTTSDYLRTFERVDLVSGRWRIAEARATAAQLTHRRRVLLGAKVAAAHGLPFTPFSRVEIRGHVWLVWPHPSGRCRLWTPAAVGLARLQMAELRV